MGIGRVSGGLAALQGYDCTVAWGRDKGDSCYLISEGGLPWGKAVGMKRWKK